MPEKKIIEISFETLIKAALLILGIIFIYSVSDLLIIFFLSLIIGSTVSLWAKNLLKFKIPKLLSILLIYLFGFLTLGLFLSLIIPPLVQEINVFAEKVPIYYETIYSLVSKYLGGVDKLSPNLGEIIVGQSEKLKDLGTDIFSFLIKIFGGFASFIALVVISFYLAFEEKGIERILRILTPLKYEDYILDLWARSQFKLGCWFSGQIILALIIGSLVFIGLSLIGVPYALLLGFIAAILEIVPFVGPVISAVIGVIVALTVSLKIGLFTLIFYLIIQQFENHLIVPLLLKRVVGLNPVVIIMSLMIGFKLGGILGMMVGVPISAILGELIKDLAGKKNIEINS